MFPRLSPAARLRVWLTARMNPTADRRILRAYPAQPVDAARRGELIVAGRR